MSALGDLLGTAPSGLLPLMMITGVWSGVFDAHISQRMKHYGESKLLRGVGLTYLSMGIILWIASLFLG